MKKKFFFYLIFIIFTKKISSKLLKDNIVLLSKNKIKNKFENTDFEILFKDQDRFLMEINPKRFLKTITLKKNNKENSRRLKMFKIIASILKNAKNRKLKIKNIKVGKNIRKMLNLNKSLRTFKTYLNDKDFLNNYQKLLTQNKQKKRQQKQRKLKLKKIKYNQRAQQRKTPDEKPKDDHTKFNFDSGFAGMPFPPFMMDGPTFHPPMNIKINAFPFPNPRAETPYEVAQSNTKNMTKDYDDLNGQMDQVDDELNDTSMVINNTLNELSADIKNELMKS